MKLYGFGTAAFKASLQEALVTVELIFSIVKAGKIADILEQEMQEAQPSFRNFFFSEKKKNT